MLTKKAVLATAVVWWSEKDEFFLCESPLLRPCIAHGKTEKKARKLFEEFLDDNLKAMKKGKLAGHDADGTRNYPNYKPTQETFSIYPDTQNQIHKLARKLDISPDQVVEWCVFAMSTR
jgi:predicted RNase H-like HicB family nuclease